MDTLSCIAQYKSSRPSSSLETQNEFDSLEEFVPCILSADFFLVTCLTSIKYHLSIHCLLIENAFQPVLNICHGRLGKKVSRGSILPLPFSSCLFNSAGSPQLYFG